VRVFVGIHHVDVKIVSCEEATCFGKRTRRWILCPACYAERRSFRFLQCTWRSAVAAVFDIAHAHRPCSRRTYAPAPRSIPWSTSRPSNPPPNTVPPTSTILRQEFVVDVAAVEERPSMPSLAKLKSTRKRHFYCRRPQRQEDFAGLHARHRANGRIASLGWARCGSCGHKECWLSLPWLNDDVVCSCGGSVGIESRGLRPEDAAWRDCNGVIHLVPRIFD
jgi:hypothetical protein